MTGLSENLSTTQFSAAAYSADLELATKYSRPGPRYTSYPTAPQFVENFPQEQYRRWLDSDSSHQNAPLSLYVHLPFCQDICYYCACNKEVTRDKGVARAYLERLEKEIHMQSELVGNRRPITQMHWGGGTPTYLDNAEITQLMHALASNFRLLDKGYREYSIEIDPRTVQPDTIALLKGIGFNRISLGIQDFDPRVQKAVNRIQPFDAIVKLVESIREHGFRSLSFDLIYGLPYQHQHSMAQTLEKVIQLRPDRIACYNYAHLPERFSSQRSIDRLTLPKPEEKLLLQLLISHTLTQAGYLHIGMDHYVLPDDELAAAQSEGRLQRNFQGYSLHMADDLLGLGVSAISEMGDFYLQNETQLSAYYDRVDKGDVATRKGRMLQRDDRLRRYIIMSLICELQLDLAECKSRFGIEFAQYFERELRMLSAMQNDGLLSIDKHKIVVLNAGRPFLRNICMPFDAYLENLESSHFSSTI